MSEAHEMPSDQKIIKFEGGPWDGRIKLMVQCARIEVPYPDEECLLAWTPYRVDWGAGTATPWKDGS